MYNPRIAVIDSGIDTGNGEMRKSVAKGIGFIYDPVLKTVCRNKNYEDCFGHGTNCADLIMQICPEVKLYPIKIVNDKGKTKCELLISALEECADMPVDIICVSLAVTGSISEKNKEKLYEICNKLNEQKKLICVSDCNDEENSIPAIFDNVIGVKALKSDRKKVIINADSAIQVEADTTPVFVLGRQGKYNFFKGTSKANAFIVGVLAAEREKGEFVSIGQALKTLDEYSLFHSRETQDLHMGLLPTDSAGKYILENIKNVLEESGYNYDLNKIVNYPFISSVTGINFFNFYDFIRKVYAKLNIQETDYHQLKIHEVCTLYELAEYLKRKIHNEEKYSI